MGPSELQDQNLILMS
jgi:hypothetical protein